MHRILKNTFQFQIGAIKRSILHPYATDYILFQFQIGAIKRYRILPISPMLRPCFNSKLVRLKEHFGIHTVAEWSEFQFQIGAIKS